MLDMKDYDEYIEDVLSKGYIDTCICTQNISDEPYAICPINNEINTDYINEYGLTTIHSRHCGGALVFFPQDIAFTWVSNLPIYKKVIIDIYNYLLQFNSELTIDNNDIMLGNRKFLGIMGIGRCPCYQATFFSFDNDIDVIKNVSLKEMKKTPIGLSSIGVTPEDIKVLIDNICKKYNLKKYNGGDK